MNIHHQNEYIYEKNKKNYSDKNFHVHDGGKERGKYICEKFDFAVDGKVGLREGGGAISLNLIQI